MTDSNFPPDWTPDQSFGDGRVGLRLVDRVAILAIQIPQKLNALDEPATAGMVKALETAVAAGARALIFTGIGGKSFISGANLSGFEGPRPTGVDFVARQKMLLDCPIPIIAAIKGYCIGGGLMTAMNCDFRLASSDSSFGIPATRLGLSYGSEGLQSLVDAIGPARTRRLLFVGDRVDAETARDWGLVEHVYAPDALWPAALNFANQIAANAPLSVRATKETIADLLKPESARNPARIAEIALECRESHDFREGRDAVREKRPPRFEGR
ncbi:enoyl-CoA hydratase-related protein [Pseudooceanicola sp.]|uniref:enoyl-CoA hydratase-related protein n=1 Tax=Pseudooceanicola sp. TaxID=1914328 RepID=UPI0026290558|nr:enoyl-CoA hydratase-related protein [Pseudooceanicola sp.]MDF1856620.1 enoyl-CoA hydratase-related protein [Pseudooceanicola sp.]